MIGSLFLYIVTQNTLCSLPVNTVPCSPDSLTGMKPEGLAAHPVFSSQTVAEQRFEPRTGYDNPADSCIHSFSPCFFFPWISVLSSAACGLESVDCLPSALLSKLQRAAPELWFVRQSCRTPNFYMIFLSSLHVVLIQMLVVLIILLEQMGTLFSGPGSSLGSHVAFSCREYFFFFFPIWNIVVF